MPAASMRRSLASLAGKVTPRGSAIRLRCRKSSLPEARDSGTRTACADRLGRRPDKNGMPGLSSYTQTQRAHAARLDCAHPCAERACR